MGVLTFCKHFSALTGLRSSTDTIVSEEQFVWTIGEKDIKILHAIRILVRNIFVTLDRDRVKSHNEGIQYHTAKS